MACTNGSAKHPRLNPQPLSRKNVRSSRLARGVMAKVTRYAPKAKTKPSGTSSSICGEKSAAPNACSTAQGSVNVNTIFDTNSPGMLPSLPV